MQTLVSEKSFYDARFRVMGELATRIRGAGGIGTQSEKMLHSILKYAIEPDETLHEVKRYGSVAECSLRDFLRHCKDALQCNGLRYVDGGKPVRRVAVCGGSGSSMLEDVVALGCDTFVTADVKHNGFLDAREMGLNLIDAGHFCTENPVVPHLAAQLQAAFPEITVIVSEKHADAVKFF